MVRTKNALYLPAGFIIAVFQNAAILLCRLLILPLGRFRRDVTLKPVHADRRYIIAANHQSQLDPFVIGYAFPAKQRLKLTPIKSFLKPQLYHSVLKPFAYLVGCYPAHAKYRPHHTAGVEGSIKLLDYGYNLCVFPEGKRTVRSESKPYNGISRILEAYPGTNLLLAHIEWERKGRWRRNVTVKISDAPANLHTTDPEKIMDAVYRL